MASHRPQTIILPYRPGSTHIKPPEMAPPRVAAPTRHIPTNINTTPSSSPSYELFIATFPDRSADCFVIRSWIQIWFDSCDLFASDVGVKTFLSQIHLNGLQLRCLSREYLLKSLAGRSMNDRGASYPDAVIQALFEDVEKARLFSLEECEKEMEKKIMKITFVNHLRSSRRKEDERWSGIGALCWMALSGFRKSQKEEKLGEAWKYALVAQGLLRVWEKVTVRPGAGSQAELDTLQRERDAMQRQLHDMLMKEGLLTGEQVGQISLSALFERHFH